MRIWTYAEASGRILEDLDMQDEDFIGPDELAGKFNDAIDEAEAEIHRMSLEEDYFLSRAWIPLVSGEDELDLPDDIYAQKIRALIYIDNTLRYPIKRFRGSNKFIDYEDASSELTQTDYYRYLLLNSAQGEQAKMLIVPAAQETAAQKVRLWYIRNANRIPMLEEVIAWDTIAAETDVDASANTLAVNRPLTTGDVVQLSGSDLPEPLVEDTDYYVIRVSASSIRLAATLAEAESSTPIDITDTGTGTITLSVQITETLRGQVKIDIPEFASFLLWHTKLQCLDKDTDPRYNDYKAERDRQRVIMVETLTERVPDQDDKAEMDLSHYMDHT